MASILVSWPRSPFVLTCYWWTGVMIFNSNSYFPSYFVSENRKLFHCFQFYFLSWTSGLNFINVLRTAFMCVDPKRVKRYWQLDWVLTLWGATSIKALCKYVDEIDPWAQRHKQIPCNSSFVMSIVTSLQNLI